MADSVSTSCSEDGGRDSIEEGEEEECMVGFEDQTLATNEQLLGSCKQLEIISIVGMVKISHPPTSYLQGKETQLRSVKKRRMDDNVSISCQEDGGSNSIEEEEEEVCMVGFEDQTLAISEQLLGSRKQLEIISIVGMAGNGKTTLARNVFDDPSIEGHFYIRGWATVSHEYQKKDLLLQILSSPQIQASGLLSKMTEERLSEELHKSLKGKRYLIVMDDVWNVKAWNDVKRCFPDDKNGSRVLFTSRLKEVASLGKLHEIRFLSKKESWELLRQKVEINMKTCPSQLIELGKQIAEKCQGLPLSIVVIGGLLANTEKTLSLWKHVAESIRPYIVGDSNQCMDTLSLSYNHLPDHLKPCFIYFGLFPEDCEVPVQKLISLWIAEGFVQVEDEQELEDVAESYLQDLIKRSLILSAKRRSNGRLKTCGIHDALRDLCLHIGTEQQFLEHIYCDNKQNCYEAVCGREVHRICIHSETKYNKVRVSATDARSLFFSCSILVVSFPEAFKLLTVLDSYTIESEFSIITELVHLRYLAVYYHRDNIPDSISNLKNLETLIVRNQFGTINLPLSLFSMQRLRHIRIRDNTSIEQPYGVRREFPQMKNLQTISTLQLVDSGSDLLKAASNLKKLRCNVRRKLWCFDFLTKLETMKMFYHGNLMSTNLHNLPGSLKKLSLYKFRLPWSDLSKLGRLPNLEVLKLLSNAFYGKCCDLGEEEEDYFPKLRYLKFDTLNIEQWKVTDDNFPELEQLELVRCRQLEEIPLSLGDITKLDKIEVRWCSKSAAESAMQIKEEQLSNGKELKVIVHPPAL